MHDRCDHVRHDYPANPSHSACIPCLKIGGNVPGSDDLVKVNLPGELTQRRRHGTTYDSFLRAPTAFGQCPGGDAK